jgi:5'-nucleotidase
MRGRRITQKTSVSAYIEGMQIRPSILPTGQFLRILATPLAALALVLAGAGFWPGASPGDAVKFVILHTNDIHGQVLPRDARDRKDERVGGIAAVESYVRKEREAASKSGARFLLIDSGDWYQGTPEGNFAKDNIPGALVVDWMNRAGFDAAVIGNHEFDFGRANVSALLARAKFTVLGANVLAPVAAGPDPGKSQGDGRNGKNDKKEESLAPIAKPWLVSEHGGVRLSVVGLLTADTPRMVAEGRLGDVTIPDEFSEGRKWYDRARKESDIVIFATHCGRDIDEQLARRIPETPLILGGHSHTRIKQPNFVEHESAALSSNPWKSGLPVRTYVTQTGSKTEAIDRVEIWIDPATRKIEKIDTKLVDLYVSEVGEVEGTKKWLESETAPIVKDMETTIGALTAPEKESPRGRQTDPTGNLATDALLWYARRIDPKCVAAFNNSSGIRTKVKTGKLTKRGIYEIIPFDNTVVLMTLSGADLLGVVRESMSGNGRLLTAGLEGFAKQNDDGSVDASELKIGGKPFDIKVNYRVAANSFIAAGKGGLASFAKGTDRSDTGALVRDTILEFVADRKEIVLDDFLRLRVQRSKNVNAKDAEPVGAGSKNEKKQ